MATQYKVVAPYVTLKVKDPAGADVLIGFYEGAIVENIEADSLKSHLDKGMVEKVSASQGDGGSEFDPAADRSAEELQKLKVDQLKAYADKHEVDLAGATKKDEILSALAAAQESGQGDGSDQGAPELPAKSDNS